MGIARAILVAFLACALASCAGRARNVLVPTAMTDPDASRVDMLVVTTRAKTSTPGEVYSGERSPVFSLTNIVVSIPPDERRKVGEVQWPRQLPANPQAEFATLKVDSLEPRNTRAWFKRTAGPGRRVLIFVHGFNNTFEDAAYRFAQIVHDSGANAAPILFTWPSRGSVWAYVYDRESATYSRNALERVLMTAATDPSVSDVTVMAHSMGNWVLAESLRQMAIRNGRIPPKIRNIIMAAPDLDVDVFRTQFLDIPEPRPTFTLFVSKDDRALALSQRISGGVDRLGSIDPDVEPYRSKLAASKIVVIDLTKVRAGDALNHGKFAQSPEVVRLIGEGLVNGHVMHSELTLGERITHASTSAAAALGSTIGTAVSAPIAIIDPATRERLPGQIESTQRSISDSAAATAGQ